jgi:hypothetical protein
MVDCRYSDKNWKAKLPQWIMRGFRGEKLRSNSVGENIVENVKNWFEKMNKG